MSEYSKETNQFKEMKEYAAKLKSGIGSREVLENYVQGVIISGYHSKYDVLRSYCLYASTVGIRYFYNCDYPMMAAIDENSSYFIGINPVVLMSMVSTENQIRFILAHEVKHIIYRHVIKYKNFFDDEVNQVLMNLATDAEVNANLEKELGIVDPYGYSTISSNDVIPDAGCFDLYSVNDIVYNVNYNFSNEVLYPIMHKDRLFNSRTGKVEDFEGKSIADIVYLELNKCCKVLLGKDINTIIYNCKIMGKSFKQEIWNMATVGYSELFDVKEEWTYQAVKFCEALLKYLRFSVTAFIVTGITGESGGSSKSTGGNSSTGKNNESGNSENNSNNASKENTDDSEDTTEKDDDCGNSSSFVGDSKKENSLQKENDKKVKDAFEERDKRKTVEPGVDVDWYDVEDNISLIEDAWLNACEVLGIKARGEGSTNNTMKVKPFKTKSAVPWQAVLRNRLNGYSREFEGTKKRINRRQPERLDLSGRKRKRVLSLIMGIDESGSISDREYNYFIEEVFKIVQDFNCCLHLYEFSGEIEAYTYVPQEKIKSFKREKKEFVSRRFNGGTSYQPVFDAIADNRDIEKESLLIMFTDGYGEYEVDFKKQKDRLWVVVGGSESISCKENSNNVYPVVRI